jgi:hypothetical protein
MNYRYAVATVALLAVAFGSSAPSLADDKQLKNVKGSVSYQTSSQTAVPVGVNAIVGVADNSYAITGDSSLGALIMPDSSQVMVGASSKVQVAYFNQTNTANAKFVLYNGKVRFEVRHPQGAQANYTFQTATGSVAVRGTQGDIEYDTNGNLRVNVYELCDKNYPVQITTKTGKVLNLLAGQSLAAQFINGVLQTNVQQITQQIIDQFSPDFGVPTNWDAAKGQIVSYAQGQVNQAVGQIPGSQYVPGVNVGNIFGGGHKATPQPSPGAEHKSATCGAK